MPTRDMLSFIESDRGYFIQVDLEFKGSGRYTWDTLEQNFRIWYNLDHEFDDEDFGSAYGDMISLYASDTHFGFQYQELQRDSAVPLMVKLDTIQLSKTQTARREFKVRVDVEEGGYSYLLINGKDMGKLPYNYPMKSAAVVQYKHNIPILITTRLCKSEKPEDYRRRRRSATSLHKWGTNVITYNFQNYSSSLGEEDTRAGVRLALEHLTRNAKLTFIEKAMDDVVMLSYMFIRGRHADGKTFFGPGAEKGHAFVPVHSEIHFNDYEAFSLKRGTGMCSDLHKL